MKNASSRSSHKGYKIIGRTSDGVEILAPKAASVHFTHGPRTRKIIEVVGAENKGGNHPAGEGQHKGVIQEQKTS